MRYGFNGKAIEIIKHNHIDQLTLSNASPADQ